MHGSDISQLEAPNEVSFSTKQQPRSEELFVCQFAQTEVIPRFNKLILLFIPVLYSPIGPHVQIFEHL